MRAVTARPLARDRRIGVEQTLRLLGCLAATLVVLVSAGNAQSFRGGQRAGTRSSRGWDGFWRSAPRYATPASFDGAFHFCRIQYGSGVRARGGSGWATDYPGADENFSIRVSELTKTWVGMSASGEPQYLVVRPTDEALFKCPFTFIEEVGALQFSDADVETLRKYLLKGGFLWADDFWGDDAWANWVREIGRVLPPAQYPVTDIPPGHPMLHTLFQIGRVPQVPSIQFWRGTGGATSERGAESAEQHARMIADERGRIMVLMTHNTDMADTWEREGEDPAYFYAFSPDGYAFGIDVLLYSMTH